MARKKEAQAAEQPGRPVVTVAGTPRAAGSVRRIKSRAGLAGFLLVGLVSWRHGLPVAEAVERALAGGVIAYLAAWSAAVAAWRHILRAHTRVRLEAARRAFAAANGEADGADA